MKRARDSYRPPVHSSSAALFAFLKSCQTREKRTQLPQPVASLRVISSSAKCSIRATSRQPTAVLGTCFLCPHPPDPMAETTTKYARHKKKRVFVYTRRQPRPSPFPPSSLPAIPRREGPSLPPEQTRDGSADRTSRRPGNVPAKVGGPTTSLLCLCLSVFLIPPRACAQIVGRSWD